MATVTWTGAVSTTYSTDGNWDTGSKPTSSDDVIIANVTNDCVLTGSPTVNSWTVQSGARFNGNTETITVVGENSSGFAIDIDGEVVGTTTNFTVETPAATNIDLKATSGNVRHVTINHASCAAAIAGGFMTITGNLTITAGSLNTGGNDLTVAGALANDGTLTLNGSTVNLGSTSTEAGDVTGAGTFNLDTSTINYHTAGGANFIPSTSANFDTNTSTLNLIGLNGSNRAHNFTFASGNMHNITTSRGAGTDTHTDTLNGNCTITGNLTVGANSNFSTGTRVFTVNGDVDVTGQLISNGSDKPMTFGGIRINSGGTYNATSGTTEVTNRFTGTSNVWKNDGGTFTHNNGTVKFTDNDHSKVKEQGSFYNFEQASSLGDYALVWETAGGGSCTILNNLTITRGDFELVNADDTCDIHGQTIINGSSNSAARFNNDKNQTGTITHHGLVTIIQGTYHVEDGATVNMTGIRNVGGLVD